MDTTESGYSPSCRDVLFDSSIPGNAPHPDCGPIVLPFQGDP
jgi:hypothetical protein